MLSWNWLQFLCLTCCGPVSLCSERLCSSLVRSNAVPCNLGGFCMMISRNTIASPIWGRAACQANRRTCNNQRRRLRELHVGIPRKSTSDTGSNRSNPPLARWVQVV